MLVLDFDGTLTDAEAEGLPYREGYLADLAVLTGASLDIVKALAAEIEEQVLADRDRHGWIYNGQVVAPASVDPYLRTMPVARGILDHFGAIPSDTDRARLLDGILYKYNYPKSDICFREGAADFLARREGRPTWIVTNSGTEAVQRKVRALSQEASPSGCLDWLVERVLGFAKKYVVEPEFEGLPASMELAGLSRPVLLRRKKYLETLQGLLGTEGLDWSELTVVGDIFELDLAIPLHMGARVGLVVNDFTPPYEKAFLEQHPRGALLPSLADAEAFADEA